MSAHNLRQFVTIGIISVVSLFSPLHAQTQSAINAQARTDFQRADADLPDTEKIKALLTAKTETP